MFETKEFYAQLDQAVRKTIQKRKFGGGEAGRESVPIRGLARKFRYRGGRRFDYEPDIIEYLHKQAMNNERDYAGSLPKSREVRTEMAMASTRKLVVEAIKNARERNAAIITLSDLEAAKNKLFCTVWPFCKPSERI